MLPVRGRLPWTALAVVLYYLIRTHNVRALYVSSAVSRTEEDHRLKFHGAFTEVYIQLVI